MPGEVLPMGIMRSFSGGGAEGMMSDLLATYGTQSQIGRIASLIAATVIVNIMWF